MTAVRSNTLRNYLREKWLRIRLRFMRQAETTTDFLDAFQQIKKVMIIPPRDRAEEVRARDYILKIREIFRPARVNIVDVAGLHDTDTNWLGLPNDFFLSRIRDENYDLAIDLNSHHDSFSTYMICVSGAPLRLHLTEGRYDAAYNLHFRGANLTSFDKTYRNLLDYLTRMRQPESQAQH